MNKNIFILKSKKEFGKNNNIEKENQNENNKRKLNINYSKLKFNKNLLIELLKKTLLKKISNSKNKSKNSNSSRVQKYNNNTDQTYNLEIKKRNILYNSFFNNPEMKKFHNITAEKLNDLIQYSYETDKSQVCTNLKLNNLKVNNKKDENVGKSFIKNLKAINNNIKRGYHNYYQNNRSSKTNDKYPKYKNNIKHINIKDLNISEENIFPYISTGVNYHNLCKKYNSLSKSKKANKNDKEEKITKNIFMSKTSTNYATNKWLKSIKDSIKKYDVLHRSSRVDRLIFSIENPDGCFEESLFEDRPGDKYILFKNQMVKHKDKFENIIREIKLNQKKSEYLMKKYIFDLLSRKKPSYQ